MWRASSESPEPGEPGEPGEFKAGRTGPFGRFGPDGPGRDPRDWYEREPRIRELMRSELTRLKRRTKAHPVRVFLLAALLTAGVVWKYSRRAPTHKARVILRVTEGELTHESNPLPAQDYVNYIWDTALTRDRLRDLIHRLDIFQDEREEFGDDYAVSELRDALSVGVRRNYFFFYRNYESVPRSLRLVISFQDKDPEFAYRMARELAHLVIDVETSRRRELSMFAARNAEENIERLQMDVALTEGQLGSVIVLLAQAEQLADRDAVARLTTKVDTLNALLTAEQRNLDALLAKLSQIQIERELDQAQMGLTFEIAGEVIPRATPPPGPIVLALLGVVVFGVFLPLCSIGFGVFDAKIHDLEDVSRLDIPVLGHVHAFGGMGRGSLLERASAGKGRLARLALRLHLRRIRWHS